MKSYRLLLLVAALAFGAWIVFFDSHSVLRRWQWHRELARLEAQNAALETRIGTLEMQLQGGIPDEVVEAIAREQYGMYRPGETVYPLAAE